MRLLLLLLLLAPVAFAMEWRELEVKGHLTCSHITLDLWSFKVSLLRLTKFDKVGKVEMVDNKTVEESAPFLLQSPSGGPFVPIGLYDYLLKVDGPKLCPGLPKYIPLDASKRNIDLGVVDLRKI